MAKMFGMLTAAVAVSVGLMGCGGGGTTPAPTTAPPSCTEAKTKEYNEATKDSNKKIKECTDGGGGADPLEDCKCTKPHYAGLITIANNFIDGDCKEKEFLDLVKGNKVEWEGAVKTCDDLAVCDTASDDYDKAKKPHKDAIDECRKPNADGFIDELAACTCTNPQHEDWIKLAERFIGGDCKLKDFQDKVKGDKSASDASITTCAALNACLPHVVAFSTEQDAQVAAEGKCETDHSDDAAKKKDCKCKVFDKGIANCDQFLTGACKEAYFHTGPKILKIQWEQKKTAQCGGGDDLVAVV